MNDIKETWFKWDYVCTNCDSHIEMTIKSNGQPHAEICPNCNLQMTLMSVVDATIDPITQKKEETDMETTEPNLAYQIKQEYELRYGNTITELTNELNALKSAHLNCDYWKSENGRVQGQIIDLINEYYENDTDAVDIIQSLCETIDYQPKKEIEFTATIRFTGKMEVDAWEYSNNFNVADALADAYVDINNGDVVIDSYDLEDAEEC